MRQLKLIVPLRAIRTKSAATKVTALFPILALAIASACCPLFAGQQSSWRPFSHRRPYTSVDDMLDKDAEASDAAGIHNYGQDLAHLFVPDRAGEDYINSFGDRLAQAELLARKGKGKLVPEVEVARAFNDLMKRIEAPTSFKTDESTIRKFRAYSIAVPSLPALLSADRNGTNCNPGEAVYLLHLLILSNGELPNSYLDREATLKREEARRANGGAAPMGASTLSVVQIPQDASWFLSSYSSHHHRNATIKLFNDATQTFSF